MRDVVDRGPGIVDSPAVDRARTPESPRQRQAPVSFRRTAMKTHEQFGMTAQPSHFRPDGNVLRRCRDGVGEWSRKNAIGLIVTARGCAKVQALAAGKAFVLDR